MKPHFRIKNNFQKMDIQYSDLLPSEILSDICLRVTGRTDYSVDFDESGYNIGRLLILEYKHVRNFISLSEIVIKSRNSSFQSLPSALSRYIIDDSPKKEIYFYFHPSISGNFQTSYFVFMYRLMKTAKIRFLNEADFLHTNIVSFSAPEDIIASKELIRARNRSNKSTYVTRGPKNELQIYGKTYGANKYETTIICAALSEISLSEVQLYQIGEGGLTELPKLAKEAIESLGNVYITTSNEMIEREYFEENDSLRSPEYTYNLFEKFGEKRCSLCGCSISQIIQGAHIWPVKDIKRNNMLTREEKLACALDGENGLWLCQNHHKLLDSNILRISEDGLVEYSTNTNRLNEEFLRDATSKTQLDETIMSSKFKYYLRQRNEDMDDTAYSELA